MLFQFNNKMVKQVHLGKYFDKKKSFARTGIQTHDLPTQIFLPGILTALIKSIIKN